MKKGLEQSQRAYHYLMCASVYCSHSGYTYLYLFTPLILQSWKKF